MKLKIVEPGWENFSGNLGITMFADGVSVGDVSRIESNSISGNIRVVDVETETSVSAIEFDSMLQEQPCVSESLQTLEEILQDQDVSGVPGEGELVPTKVVTKIYTQEELEGIADREGIVGLRSVGETLSVKGTSIAGLIAAILATQSGEVVVEDQVADEVHPEVVAEVEVKAE